MKVVAICAVLLVELLLHGSVLANSSAEAESNTDNGNEQSSPSVRESVDTNANSSHSGRIINGKQGNVATFPYIVRMRVKNEGYCGATIITYWHVFTAAHCVYHIEDPATVSERSFSWYLRTCFNPESCSTLNYTDHNVRWQCVANQWRCCVFPLQNRYPSAVQFFDT